MKLGIWDNPAAAFLVSGLESSPVAQETSSVIETHVISTRDALDELLTTKVDIALISPVEALCCITRRWTSCLPSHSRAGSIRWHASSSMAD
jgi:hypothetical protein